MSVENKGWFKRRYESLFGAPTKEPEIKKSGTVIIGEVEQDYGVRLSTSFKDQVTVFNSDPVIRTEITSFAQEVISQGIFTSIDETYTLALSGKTSKQTIDEWNRQNDLDNKMLQIAIELVAFGNSLWLISEGGFVNIPIQAINKAIPIDKTTPIREKYHIQLTSVYGSKVVKWEEFIHFRAQVTGYAPFGTGIILGIIAIPDEDTPSIWEIRKSVRASMKKGFEKFSFGNEMWCFPELSDENLKIVGPKVDEMDSTGQRIATNTKGEIQLAVPQRTQSYDKWIEQVDKEFYNVLGGNVNPNTEFTTKATAEAVRAAFEMRVASMRRVIKRQIEGLWVKVLDKLGFEGLKSGIRLNFGSEDVQYVVADIFAAVDKGILSKEEARKILKKSAHWQLTEDSPPPEAKPAPVTQPQGVANP